MRVYFVHRDDNIIGSRSIIHTKERLFIILIKININDNFSFGLIIIMTYTHGHILWLLTTKIKFCNRKIIRYVDNIWSLHPRTIYKQVWRINLSSRGQSSSIRLAAYCHVEFCLRRPHIRCALCTIIMSPHKPFLFF